MLCDIVFNDKSSGRLLKFKQGVRPTGSAQVQAVSWCGPLQLAPSSARVAFLSAASRRAAVAYGRTCTDPTQQEKGRVRKPSGDIQGFCAHYAIQRVEEALFFFFFFFHFMEFLRKDAMESISGLPHNTLLEDRKP